MGRCLVSRHQTLIGIHQRIQNQRHSFDMFQNSSQKIVCLLAQSVRIMAVLENVSAVTGQRHVNMHAGTIHTIFRLWHKGCMKTMALRDSFDHKFKCANVICCLQRLVIFEVNLMIEIK